MSDNMSDDKIDFKYLSRAVLSRANEFLPGWLPGGKIVSNEYTCASIKGGEGRSMKVNVRSGKWADFANGDRGGDLISLYATINNISQVEAAKQLSREVGHRLPDPRHTLPKAVETVLMKPPKGTSRPKLTHNKFGEPTATYTYRDEGNDVLFFICRYDPTDDRKQFIPYSWSSAGRWVLRQWPAPRPLFGLEQFQSESVKKPILICEGEKSALAARQIVGDNYIVVTWPGGAQAWNKSDWRPLYGRNVLIWPDADEPGRQCGADLAAHLVPHARSVKILIPPNDLYDGWDAADALEEGFDWAKFKSWAKPLAKLIEVTGRVDNESPTMPQTNINILVAGDDAIEQVQFTVSPNVYANIERCQLQVTGKERRPVKSLSNIARIFSTDFKSRIWFDEFYGEVMTDLNGTTQKFTEKDMYNLTLTIQSMYGLKDIGHDLVFHGITAYAFQNVRNEPREWMSTLKWDETPRVPTFFHKYMGSPLNHYTEAVSRNFWVSMVARTFKPGCKCDNMVILEGAQGSYKSSALEAIAGKWFTETATNPTDKDFYLILRGALIVEIAELDAFSRAETNTIKKVVSCHTDRYRAPYGRTTQDWPRRSIFAGTTNKDDYLRDETGARRFWPIHTTTIDLDAIRQDRDQLFAEAKYLFDHGHKWHSVPKEEAEAEQLKRLEKDPWHLTVLQYASEREYCCVHDILVDAIKIPVSQHDKRSQMRVSAILKSASFLSNQERRLGKKTMWYKNPSWSGQISMKTETHRSVKNYADDLS